MQRLCIFNELRRLHPDATYIVVIPPGDEFFAELLMASKKSLYFLPNNLNPFLPLLEPDNVIAPNTNKVICVINYLDYNIPGLKLFLREVCASQKNYFFDEKNFTDQNNDIFTKSSENIDFYFNHMVSRISLLTVIAVDNLSGYMFGYVINNLMSPRAYYNIRSQDVNRIIACILHVNGNNAGSVIDFIKNSTSQKNFDTRHIPYINAVAALLFILDQVHSLDNTKSFLTNILYNILKEVNWEGGEVHWPWIMAPFVKAGSPVPDMSNIIQPNKFKEIMEVISRYEQGKKLFKKKYYGCARNILDGYEELRIKKA